LKEGPNLAESGHADARSGAQSDPVVGFDADGALRVVWLDRDDAAGTRVRYSRAVRR
jgi:hypothetical protein